jgi:hypothetical protein
LTSMHGQTPAKFTPVLAQIHAKGSNPEIISQLLIILSTSTSWLALIVAYFKPPTRFLKSEPVTQIVGLLIQSLLMSEPSASSAEHSRTCIFTSAWSNSKNLVIVTRGVYTSAGLYAEALSPESAPPHIILTRYLTFICCGRLLLVMNIWIMINLGFHSRIWSIPSAISRERMILVGICFSFQTF